MNRPVNIVDKDQHLSLLHELRSAGNVITTGLSDEVIVDFLARDPSLAAAIDRAHSAYCSIKDEYPALLEMDEAEQALRVQQGYVNFYAADAVNRYVAVAAQGPWIITLKGAVVYDCGGYGMLGLGHAPEPVLRAMNKPHVMANVMTPSVSQMRFIEALRREIGQSRGGSPFTRFLCLNSGSEAVSVAARIADIASKEMTDPGGRYDGFPIRGLTLRGSFHGRTDRPARHSHSTQKNYRKYLASYRTTDYLLTVEPNNIDDLEAVFAKAEKDRVFIEAFFMEPVMGEGNPGQAVTPEFYSRARELTEKHGCLLLVDSIQAGLRAHGVLSIVDYPGFSDLPPPDMEAYSKALNAGQFPLSVLALSGRATTLYRAGIYGNTMTSNPRALDVAVAVLESISPEIRENIRTSGSHLVEKFTNLAKSLDGAITKVQGTGLLLSCELDPRYKCFGENSTEEYLRTKGLGVIHGGTNSLRFTPHFRMNDAEADLVVSLTGDALVNGPKPG